MTVEGKVIFITGAATGIGHAVAGRFRVDGVLVVGTDLPARVDEIGDVADLALAADVTRRRPGACRGRRGGVEVRTRSTG